MKSEVDAPSAKRTLYMTKRGNAADPEPLDTPHVRLTGNERWLETLKGGRSGRPEEYLLLSQNPGALF